MRKLTFLEHLEELRLRIIKYFIFLIFVSFLVYPLVPFFINFIIRPIKKLVFIYPTEVFSTYIYIAILGGFFFSLPFLLYQIWSFVSLALKESEKKIVLFFGIFSFLLFIGGCSFGFFVLVPYAMRFLLSFSHPSIEPMLTLSRYISFIGFLTFSSGIVFQFPLIIIFLSRLGIIKPNILVKKRKEAIVLAFIISAIFTPTVDIFTQTILAIPLIIFYELGIFFSKFISRDDS
ncbi:MAG: twin-arginine translocase subunit TatC [Candidatus Aenigmatarchaeota archaeon]